MVNASTDDIAVIQTRLPYTDRRALSQAWFSALHCASESVGEEETHPSASPDAFVSVQASRTMQESAAEGEATQARPALRNGVSTPAPVDARGMYEPERARVRQSAGARAFFQDASPEKNEHVHFTMTAAGVRAALHVRRVGGKVIVIAVCSARHVELVRRALAEAAAGMRLQGERLDTAIRILDGEERA